MSKFLRTAALVVGGVALAATGIGAGVALGAGISYASAAGFVAGALGGVSAGALSAVAAGLSVLAELTAKKPKPVGNPMSWQSDPQAGLPIIAGRAYSGGQIVYRQTFDKDNVNQTINTVHSIGPVQGFETLYVDGVATTVAGNGQANIADRGKMFIATQRGLQPEPQQLGGTNNPGITAASKLSGLAADTCTLSFDSKGKTTFTTEPQKGWVINGVRVYDPRKDSTYPGGSGAQRWNDETTWSYVGKDNPYLFGLAWTIGWRQKGKLVAGVGAPIAAIIIEQFVEGANVSDANGWKMGGVLNTTDDKWQRLKDILLAGGGEPMRLNAQIGCLINTPRVSLATIGVSDVLPDASVQATQAMRDRINAVVPRYMAEQSITTQNNDGTFRTAVTWSLAAAGPVIVQDYVNFDGEIELDEDGNVVLDENGKPVRLPRQRQKQIDFEFVQGPAAGPNAPNQVAQLARYAIENAREFGPISLPLKLRWMGYKPGDVVTANLPELGLNGQDILLLKRSLSPEHGSVTMTARSETYAKHAFALGQTTTAPPTPTVTGPALISTPGAAAWALTGGQLVSDNGTATPALFLVGSADTDVLDGIVVEYRVSTDNQASGDDWTTVTVLPPASTGVNISAVKDQTAYQVAVSYRRGSATGDRLILGPVSAGQTQVPWSGVSDPAGTKPEDNATVGAPAGTDVAGREAATLVSDVDLNAETLLAYQFDQQTLRDYVNGLLFIAGVPVVTAVTTETSQRIDGDNALAQKIALIGASNPNGSAFILNLGTVQVGNGTSLLAQFANIDAGIADNAEQIGNVATTVSTLNSQMGSAQATITEINEVLTTPSGNASAKALFQLNSNGHVVGYAQTNDGTTGAIVFDFDSYTLLRPDGTILLTNDGGTLKLHDVEIDTLKVGSISTSGIQADAISGVTVITSSDQQITPTNGEVTVLETGVLSIGDTVDGKAQATIAFDQDALASNDAGIEINVYLDTGSGYEHLRTRYAGIGTGHGDTFWRFPVSFSVPIITSGTARVKVTAKANRLSDKFASGGGTCWVRSPEMTIVKWSR